MKKSKTSFILIPVFFLTLICISCKTKSVYPALTEKQVDLVTHKLTMYFSSSATKYLIVFESGLGDGASIWNEKNIPIQLAAVSDVLIYDRGGYGKSQKGPSPRTIDRLSDELNNVITAIAGNRKVILVSHSFGGMITRAYAIKNPTKIAALLFIDPAHELFNHPSQAEEDRIFDAAKAAYGVDFGATSEARELLEDSEYMAKLPNLPNVPVTVITSMKADAAHSQAEYQFWFNAHESLKTGVTDFQHITTIKSGHYIMIEEPTLVMENIKQLLAKLPK